MRALNQRVPMDAVKPRDYFNQEQDEMFIVCGQSAMLANMMTYELHTEITRGLWWFWLSLLGGCAILFVLFSYVFERKL